MPRINKIRADITFNLEYICVECDKREIGTTIRMLRVEVHSIEELEQLIINKMRNSDGRSYDWSLISRNRISNFNCGCVKE